MAVSRVNTIFTPISAFSRIFTQNVYNSQDDVLVVQGKQGGGVGPLSHKPCVFYLEQFSGEIFLRCLKITVHETPSGPLPR